MMTETDDRCVMRSLILPTESDARGNVDVALGLVPGSHIYGNLNGTRTEGGEPHLTGGAQSE